MSVFLFLIRVLQMKEKLFGVGIAQTGGMSGKKNW